MASAPTAAPTTLFVGVDIAAESFTAVWQRPDSSPTRPLTFEQSPTGFEALQEQLCGTGAAPAETHVVMEATSSYWVALATTLHAAGYSVSVLNPRQVHYFAQSLPRRGKTDPLDAALLACFALERRPQRWNPPPAVYHELRQRLMARDGLMEMRQQARNQRHALQKWPVVIEAVRTHLDELIDDLTTRIATLDREIAELLTKSVWAESATLLQSITGVGPVTAAWLLVGTLNFQLCSSPEAAAAYIGLVPRPRESGVSIRGRAQIGHGGHRRLRTALYLATLSAAQRNPVIKSFYERLRAAGKPMKVARCAAARKLLHLAWAVVKKKQPFVSQAQGEVTSPAQV